MTYELGGVLDRAARDFGSRPALAEPGKCISYEELNLSSDRVANALLKIGVQGGERIGIWRRKNIETIVAVYGILKAGCAYVPIDPKAGVERLAMILRDAGVRVVFTESFLASQLQPVLEARLVDWVSGTEDENRLEKFRCYGDNNRRAGSLSSSEAGPPAAYILYTSGSTGIPKGVEHTHSSAIAFASWAADHFHISDNDRLSCHAPLQFDLTTFDLFAALHKGACVVLIPEKLLPFPRRVVELIEHERITIWYSVPFALMQLADQGSLGSRNLSPLREMIFAGERYPIESLRRLAALVPHARLTNLFGPTETNVCIFHHLTAEDLAGNEACPIGQACPYASLLICGPNGRQLPHGEPGELLVGGLSVMRGYLNRPELNAQVFVQSPEGTRMFRTGDMVSASGAGILRFHGRRDRQVKVRGFRIELEEIETALLRCPGVNGAAAWVDAGENGLTQILAAVEVQSTVDVSENILIRRLASSLVQPAVPSRIQILSHLPRTVNGKIDYIALARSG